MFPLPAPLIRLFRHGTLWVAALALLLCGLVGSGLVLCIGTEGHVAVENVAAQSHPAETRVGSAATCIDLPVIEPTAPSLSKLDGGPVPPLVALLCLVWPLLWLRRSAGGPPCPRRGPDPRLFHHRTVVLLN